MSAFPFLSRYRLTRNFAIGAVIVMILAAAGLAQINRYLAAVQVQGMAARNNVSLSQTITNSLWPRFSGTFRWAQEFDADTIRENPQSEELLRDVHRLIAGTNVLRIKFYDPRGRTVFSSEAAQIGGDYSEDRHFLAALGGDVASVLSFRDSFEGFDGPVAGRWIMSSYVPVRPAGGNGDVEAVAEIYSDLTELRQEAQSAQLTESLLVGGALLEVFILLVLGVWSLERRMNREQDEKLDLAAKAARAEAANHAKSEFLGNMSHELRTPLNTIMGFSEAIKLGLLGPVGDPRYVEYASDIYKSGDQLLGIINDVTDLTKVESGTMEVERKTLDLADTVRDIVELLEDAAAAVEVELRLDLAEDLPQIETDSTKIRQILVHLMSNALKYTPPGGSVTIGIDRLDSPAMVRIRVTDTGIGMTREEFPVALAPFSQIDNSITRKREGTGLGLPLARDFTALLGGALDLESEVGLGTEVTVTLPLEGPATDDAAERSAA